MKIGIMHVMPAMENTPELKWSKLGSSVKTEYGSGQNQDTEIVFRISRRGLPKKLSNYSYMRAFSEVRHYKGIWRWGKVECICYHRHVLL
jgi:hypothetical protein